MGKWVIYVCPEHPDFPIGCALDEPAPECLEHTPPSPPMERVVVVPASVLQDIAALLDKAGHNGTGEGKENCHACQARRKIRDYLNG